MKAWLLFHLSFILCLGYISSQNAIDINLVNAIERYDLPAPYQGRQTLNIGSLTIGKHYRFEVSNAANSPGNAIEIQSGGQEITAGNFYWEGYALAPNITLTIASDDPPHFVIADMTELNSRQSTTNGQPRSSVPIQVEISNDTEFLVNSIFHSQSCFETSNHQFSGFYGQFGTIPDPISQMGVFNSGEVATGIERGIILSTGRVDKAEGPNDFTGTTQIYNTTSSDPDLRRLSGTTQLFDVVVMEFDFTPTTNFINFNYIFASEEYCEAVNNNNVDVFAFLISGPGISGPFENNAKNIAILPDGSPVNVNTVNANAGNFPELYRSNVPASFNESCQNTPPVAPNDIEYDGFTQILTASSEVLACETYHLKMIIADVGDAFYDSAVMLEAGSFTAGLVNSPEPGVTAEDAGLANAPLEGCSDGTIVFSRIDSASVDQPLTVYFSISPTSTATFGVDYTMPTDSFIIEPGQFSDTLLIDIFGDDLDEGTESIVIRLQNTCNCEANTTEFLITDPPSIDLSLPQVDTMCSGNIANIAPNVTGGIGDYHFAWSNGSTDSILNVEYLSGDSIYTLSVTDNCQQTATESVVVTAPDIHAEIRGNTNYFLCNNSSATIPVVISGTTNYTLVVDENGTSRSYTGTSDTIFLNYDSPTEVTLLSISSDGCDGIVSGTASITASNFDLVANVNNVDCFGAATGSVSIQMDGGNSNYNINWADTGLNGYTLNNLSAGNYQLTITDNSGCQLDTFIDISQPATALVLNYRSSNDQDCNQAASASVEPLGGTPPYTINWGDGGDMIADRTDLNGGQTYIVTVTDVNGCQATQSIALQDNRRQMDATIGSSSNTLTCEQSSLRVGAAFNADPVNYQWLDVSGTLIGSNDSLDITQPGTYQLIASDPTNGCSASSTIIINQSGDFLELNNGAPYILTCAEDNITLSVSPVNFTGAVSYIWTDDNGNQLGNTNSLDNVTATGIYHVAATRNDNGCVSNASITVTENKVQPTLSLASTSINCVSDTATSLVQNANGNYTYEWFTASGIIVSQVDQPSVQVTRAGFYGLIATDPSNGCRLDTFVNIVEDREELTAIAGEDILLPCGNPDFQVTGSAAPLLDGTGFRWRNADGEVLSELAAFSPTQRGTYTLEVTHPESGCVTTDELVINQEGPNEINYFLRPAPCVEIGASLTVNGIIGGDSPYTYMIDGQDVTIDENNQINGIAEGSHILTVADARGCTLETDILVFAPDVFTGMTDDVAIRLGEDAQLGFVTNRDGQLSMINWQSTADLNCTDCPEPLVALPLESFVAHVTLVDESGCELFLSQNVFVDRRQIVYTPNAISPGTPDGINDKFTLYGDSRFLTNINYLRVFSRWGTLIWEGNNLEPGNESQGWDGFFNQKPLTGGTFVFSAQVTYFDGSQEIISGNINIIN